ncbi:Homeodomain-like protein [Circinella umbellata]|nr:Homeodomain-like protein [Circinella umbellata]
MLSVTNLLNRETPTLFSKSNTTTTSNTPSHHQHYPYYHHHHDSSSTSSLSSASESLSSVASSSTSSLSAFTSIVKNHQQQQTSQHQRPAVLDICNLLSPPTSPKSSTSSLSSFESNKKKIKRKRATAKQVQVLNQVFEQTLFPSTQLRMQLGKELGMSPRTVQIWFQNRRQAIRMREQRRPSNL